MERYCLQYTGNDSSSAVPAIKNCCKNVHTAMIEGKGVPCKIKKQKNLLQSTTIVNIQSKINIEQSHLRAISIN